MLLSLTPAGDEFMVNSNPRGIDSYPSIAMDAAGGFVVAWQRQVDVHIPSTAPADIYARVYGSDFAPLGPEFPVSDSPGYDRQQPRVAMDADGDFVVAWSDHSPFGVRSVWARRFSAGGASQTFQVSAAGSIGDYLPSVAMDADGDFVIAWVADVSNQFPGLRVYARRFASNGVPIGSAIPVSDGRTSTSSRPAVACDPDGDFVVAWRPTEYLPTTGAVLARRYDATGRPLGGQITVTDVPAPTAGPTVDPAVAMDADGGFVAGWNISEGLLETGWFRRFDPAGNPRGDAIPLSATPNSREFDVSVAATPDGDAVATWQAEYTDPVDPSTRAREFPAGGPPGEPFVVRGQEEFSGAAEPVVATDANGDVIIAYEFAPATRETDGGIFARRYRLDLPPHPPRVKAASVGSSFWSGPFNHSLADYGLGAAEGVPLAPGGAASKLPWQSADTLTIRFDRNVRVGPEALSVRGRRVARYALAQRSDGEPAFTYDPATHTAVWKLAQPLDDDVVVVELDGDGPTGVTGATGLALDGDRDGTPGGDYSATVNALPGDATGDGVVNALDVAVVRQRLNSAPGDPYPSATGGYAPAADVNADGQIDVLDLLQARRRANHRLPPPPAPVPGVRAFAPAAATLFSSARLVRPDKPRALWDERPPRAGG